MSNFHQTMQVAVPYRAGQRAGETPLLSALFFPAAVLYQELLLRLFDRDVDFFSVALLRIVLFSLAAGLGLFLILDLLPWRRAARTVGPEEAVPPAGWRYYRV